MAGIANFEAPAKWLIYINISFLSLTGFIPSTFLGFWISKNTLHDLQKFKENGPKPFGQEQRQLPSAVWHSFLVLFLKVRSLEMLKRQS